MEGLGLEEGVGGVGVEGDLEEGREEVEADGVDDVEGRGRPGGEDGSGCWGDEVGSEDSMS